MKKLMKRVLIVLILIGLLAGGTVAYTGKFLAKGESWAAFPPNRHVYTEGVLTAGTVYDRNGVLLMETVEGQRKYGEGKTLRASTLHAVGDPAGNIGSGAQALFEGQLMGYNFFKGVYSLTGKGRNLYMTIDSALNETAYKALNGRKGTVGVYNYETGEILCMVSNPSYDPANPPEIEEGSSKYEGVYMNRFLSSAYTPGSVFKLVTLAAAIENVDDLFDRTFTCEGKVTIGDEVVTCYGTHGEIDIYGALANSCNCAFAELSLELGGETLERYARETGVIESVRVNEYSTAQGSFTVAEEGSADLAWSGIGQYNDLVNPCALLTCVGAIARGGVPIEPRLISLVTDQIGLPTGLYLKHKGGRVLNQDTAAILQEMMHNNVEATYGAGNFPGLDLCAKSGTAEVGSSQAPHAWFTGFIRNEGHPLAFVVVVENGGLGSSAAGAIANAVLQAAIE